MPKPTQTLCIVGTLKVRAEDRDAAIIAVNAALNSVLGHGDSGWEFGATMAEAMEEYDGAHGLYVEDSE